MLRSLAISSQRRLADRITATLVAAALLVVGSATPVLADATMEEQQTLYELNWMRWSPATYGLAAQPRPPLAVNDNLTSSAQTKAQQLQTCFDCLGPDGHSYNGVWPNELVLQHGYPLPQWWYAPPNTAKANYVESWARSSTPLLAWTQSGDHRDQVLGQSEFWSPHREAGIGRSSNGSLWTIHTGYRDDTSERLFVTGVTLNDDNSNQRMDLGEGRSGITVTLRQGSTVHFTDLSNAGGGYSLEVPGPGTYTVRASGTGFPNLEAVITVGAHNVAVDFLTNGSTQVRNFAEYADGPRLAGPNRYATAVAVSTEYFSPSSTHTVIVATGLDYPDALAAAAIAGKLDAPLLLTAPSYLPSETRSEILRLKPSTIVVVGGPAAVGSSVFAELQGLSISGGHTVVRRAGHDRYATAVEVSKHGFPTDGSADVVYIATGTNFADALTAAPAASLGNGPMLLTAPNSLPQATLDEIQRLDPDQIVVLGGTAAISMTVFNQLTQLESNTIRVSGSNRYTTAVAVSKHAFPGGSLDVPQIFVGIGTDFPDALSGAAAAAVLGAPVLLTPPSWMDSAVATEVRRLAGGSTEIVVLGGTAVFSPGLQQAFLNLLL